MDVSDCLKIECFKLLQRLVINVKNRSGMTEMFIQTLLVKNFSQNLICLFDTTSNFEIQTYCVKFLNFLITKHYEIIKQINIHKSSRNKSKQKVIHYLEQIKNKSKINEEEISLFISKKLKKIEIETQENKLMETKKRKRKIFESPQTLKKQDESKQKQINESNNQNIINVQQQQKQLDENSNIEMTTLNKIIKTGNQIKKKKKKKRKKPKFLQNLAIDTDAINDQFDVGGEHGQKKDIQEEFNYEKETIYLMAEYIVKGMTKLEENPDTPPEQIQKEDDEFLFQLYSRPKNIQKNLVPVPPAPKNAPQTVRGLKSISFQKNKKQAVIEEEEKEKEPVLALEIIKEFEDISNFDNQKDKELNIEPEKTTSRSLEESKNDSANEIYAQEILYNSIMEWVLRKIPSNVNQALMIDDTDKINSTLAINVLMSYFPNCDLIIKQKMLQDLFFLTKWNLFNTRVMAENQQFLAWILDLLFSRQIKIINSSQENLKSIIIWDLGKKIYLHLIKFIITSEKNAINLIEHLLNWFFHKQILNIKQKRILIALKLFTRFMWNLILEKIKVVAEGKLRDQTIYWGNFSIITNLTYELSLQMISIIKLPKMQLTNNSLKVKIKSARHYPINMKQTFKQSRWMDFTIIKNLLLITDRLFPSYIKSKEKDKEILEVDQILFLTKDKEYEQLFKFLIQGVRGRNKNRKRRGSFIFVIISLLNTLISELIEKKKVEQLRSWLNVYIKMFKFMIAFGENSRQKASNKNQRKIFTSILIKMIRFIHKQYDLNQNLCKMHLQMTLLDMMKFFIFTIEFVHQQAQNFIKEKKLKDNLGMIKSQGFMLLSNKINLAKDFKAYTNICQGISVKYFIIEQNQAYQELFPINKISQIMQNNQEKFNKIILGQNFANCIQQQNIVQLQQKYFPQVTEKNINENRQYFILNNRQFQNTEQYEKETYQEIVTNLKIELLDLRKTINKSQEQKLKESQINFQEKQRYSRKKWNNLWTHLRSFDGAWKHPRFYAQKDKLFKDQNINYMKEQSNIFYYKINPITIKNKCRPFLKVCLKEPDYVVKLNNKSKILNLKKTKFDYHCVLTYSNF